MTSYAGIVQTLSDSVLLNLATMGSWSVFHQSLLAGGYLVAEGAAALHVCLSLGYNSNCKLCNSSMK